MAMNKDKFQILRDFANSNNKPDKTIYEYIKEVLDMNSAYAKQNKEYKEVIDKAKNDLNIIIDILKEQPLVDCWIINRLEANKSILKEVK